MAGRHHQLDGHEFEQAPGMGDGHGSLACCSPWDCKESDTTEATEHAHKDWLQTEKIKTIVICRQRDLIDTRKKYINKINATFKSSPGAQKLVFLCTRQIPWLFDNQSLSNRSP